MAGKGSPKGVNNGGRSIGTPNKKTLEVMAKLEKLDCDPIEGMATIAAQAMKEKDYHLAGQIYKELAQYVAPKRKAIEHSTDPDDPVIIQVVNFADLPDTEELI